MKWSGLFADLPITQRLSLGFGLAGVLTLVVVLAVGLVTTANVHQTIGSFDQALGASVSLGQVRSNLESIHRATTNTLMFGVPTTTPPSEQVQISAYEVNQQAEDYLVAEGQRPAAFTAFERDWQRYQRLALVDAQLLSSSNPAAITQAQQDLTTRGEPLFSAVLRDLDVLVRLDRQQVDAAHAIADQSNTLVMGGSLAGALIGFAIMLLLGRLIVRSIVQQHQAVLRLTQSVKQGDLSKRATIKGHHEAAAIATSMNGMLETIGALLHQEASSRANLEDHLARLIAEVTPVGQGDLRLQAHVNDPLLGPLAGVFNWIVEQLATLVARVQQSAAQTTSAAQDLVEQAVELAQVAACQAAQLEQASAGMGQLATAAGEVALSARTAVGAATETVWSAQRGGQAAFQVLEQVKQGTDEVQAIEAQLRLLNQHSEEIGSMVQLIEDIARQTQVLSLNAEIQTTQMGPAQQGFSVVAEEVRRLALRTEEAVQHVTRLVHTLQGDIYSVTVNARTTTRHFHALAQLTDEAQQALEYIWSRIAQQARGIERITQVASWQEKEAAKAAASIEQLVGMANISGEIAHRQEEAAHHLAAIADELLARVAAFRLPTEVLPRPLPPAASAAPGNAREASRGANHRLIVERPRRPAARADQPGAGSVEVASPGA